MEEWLKTRSICVLKTLATFGQGKSHRLSKMGESASAFLPRCHWVFFLNNAHHTCLKCPMKLFIYPAHSVHHHISLSFSPDSYVRCPISSLV